ncbi:MAG TPA: VOC family protein [Spirochaetia bacterium]|nr:VOC family protein [Spirochaetia bacterium]
MKTELSRATMRKSIHPATRLGTVTLNVSNLDGQIEFYQSILGFALHWKEGHRAGLGAGGPDLVELVELPGARRYPGTTGLYHFAVLFPDRRALARAIARLLRARYENYPTDHIATKTTYLRDPEGQEIELYAESPEDGTMGIVEGQFVAQRADGSPSNGREPLDLAALFTQLHEEDLLDRPIPQETKVGHVHLYVRDVAESVDFYTRVIGFDDMGSSARMQAAFVSAGGYHHHVGLNSWIGRGRPPAPQGALGMRHFTVIVPDAASFAELTDRIEAAGVPVERREQGLFVRDPSDNGVLLTHA